MNFITLRFWVGPRVSNTVKVRARANNWASVIGGSCRVPGAPGTCAATVGVVLSGVNKYSL